MSEKRKELLVIDRVYLSEDYNTSTIGALIKKLKKETGFENILLVDSSKVNTQGSNNNPPIYTL